MSFSLLNCTHHFIRLIQMTLRATLQIAIHLHSVLPNLPKQSAGRIRCSLLCLDSNTISNISPYDIIRPTPQQQPSPKNLPPPPPSYIEPQSRSYYSKIISISPTKHEQLIKEVCVFRAYVEVSRIELVRFRVVFQMLIAADSFANEKSVLRPMARYECDVNRSVNVAQYVPVYFDDYEGFVLKSSYHSMLKEITFMRFLSDVSQYDNFFGYVDQITKGFKKNQMQEFQKLYFEKMEKSFSWVQDSLMNVEYQQLPKMRLNKNPKLLNEIQFLGNFQLNTPLNGKKQITLLIQEELINFKNVNIVAWNKYLESLIQHSDEYIARQKSKYDSLYKSRMLHNTFRDTIITNKLVSIQEQELGLAHLQITLKQKQNFKNRHKNLFQVQSANELMLEDTSPRIFQDIYTKTPSIRQSAHQFSGRPVFILVHGFQATRRDFQTFKGYLQTKIPNCQVFISTTNQGKTDQSIRLLARNLAREVIHFLSNLPYQFRLTFIGHSMGGIIIRQAIPHLQPFSSKFYSYISLCSPHLGYVFHGPSIVKAGLWYLKNWQMCKSIQELSMEDAEHPEDTFLYRLSCGNGLKCFQNVVFVASYQDLYVAFQSARVQKHPEILNPNVRDFRTEVASRMTQNIVSKLSTNKIHRLDVIFDIPEKNLDSFLGRSAHINLLSDRAFIKLFTSVYQHLLC